MIKTWLVTGDTHGKVAERLAAIESNPQETAVIILGDAGLNFYLNKTDRNEKRKVQQTGFTIYCVRGNHEERPGRVSTMECNWDETVHGMIYQEPEFPNIRYFVDGCEYQIANHSALIIGGAYSVDKYYRLSRYHNGQSHFLGWFEKEQLSEGERSVIMNNVCGRAFDFVLTHTCPFDWMSTDLFLPQINQSTIDKTMELWLQRIRDNIHYGVWLFGHYHDDRLVRPGVEMYYEYVEDLEHIWDRWQHDSCAEWWLKKDPNYYFGRDDK